METATTSTDNELIAEFMDCVFKKEIDGVRYYDVPGSHIESYNASQGNFAYHKRWDWLMPVVEKIGKISTGDDDFFYPRTFGMRDADGNYLFRFNRFHLITAKTLIEAAHGAVVEFIKWYNQHKEGSVS